MFGAHRTPWLAPWSPGPAPHRSRFPAPGGENRRGANQRHEEITRASRDPALIEKLRLAYAEPVVSTPDQMAAEVRRESVRWRQLIRDKNIRLD